MNLETRASHQCGRRRVPSLLVGFVVCAAAMTLLTSCGPDTSTPKTAAVAFAKAVMAGDMDTVHKTAIGTDAQFAAVKSLSDMLAAMKRYEAAAVRKFGDEGKLAKDVNKDLAEEVDAADEQINGDTASLVNKKNQRRIR